MWENPGRMQEYCKNARKRALATHDRDRNYARMIEIYEMICNGVGQEAED